MPVLSVECTFDRDRPMVGAIDTPKQMEDVPQRLCRQGAASGDQRLRSVGTLSLLKHVVRDSECLWVSGE